MKKSNILCTICGKEFSPKIKTQVYCSSDCRKIAEHRANQENKRLRSIELYKNTPGIAVCRECGFMGHDLFTHIRFAHNLTTDQYCEKYKCTKEDLLSEQTHETRSLAQKNSTNPNKKRFTSENNPMKGVTDGRNSPYSQNFIGYKGLTDEEINERISVLTKKATQSKIENASCPMHLEYYLKQGLSEEEAKKALSARQSTFSKLKCIEKLGEEEGTKRWLERQEKWLQNYTFSNYSEISQELFKAVHEKIKQLNMQVYYATFGDKYNNEYSIIADEYPLKPDFYIKDLNLVIEFDGDYWHGTRPDGISRDMRNNKAMQAAGIKYLRIKEKDFRENPDLEIDKCYTFIMSCIKEKDID